MMAKAAADYLAERDVVAIFTSPLERARETAEPLSERFRLDPVVDDRLIEPWNHFEGLVFGVGDGSLKRLEHWWYLRNPLKPSWGEQYRLIAARMLSAMGDARDAARGHEAVCISHQLPIWVTRRSVEGKRLWHHPSNRECALASVTSFTFTGDTITDVKYAEPARRLTSHGGTAQ
jgi:broad specificity phosphatase PhoE